MHTGCLRTQWTRLPDLGKGPGRGNSDGTAKWKKLSWNPKSSSCWLFARGSRERWKRTTGLADEKMREEWEWDGFMDSAGSKEKKGIKVVSAGCASVFQCGHFFKLWCGTDERHCKTSLFLHKSDIQTLNFRYFPNINCRLWLKGRRWFWLLCFQMTTHHTCILWGMGAATQTLSHCPPPAPSPFSLPCYLVSPSPVFLSFCCSPFCVSVSGSCWRGFVCEHWSPDRPTGARSMNTHTVRAALSLHTTFSTGMPEQWGKKRTHAQSCAHAHKHTVGANTHTRIFSLSRPYTHAYTTTHTPHFTHKLSESCGDEKPVFCVWTLSPWTHILRAFLLHQSLPSSPSN